MGKYYIVTIKNTNDITRVTNIFNNKELLIYELTNCFKYDKYFREFNWEKLIEKGGDTFRHYKIKIDKVKLNSKLNLPKLNNTNNFTPTVVDDDISEPIENTMEQVNVVVYDEEKSLFKIIDNDIIVKLEEDCSIVAIGKLNGKNINPELSEEDKQYLINRGVCLSK